MEVTTGDRIMWLPRDLIFASSDWPAPVRCIVVPFAVVSHNGQAADGCLDKDGGGSGDFR